MSFFGLFSKKESSYQDLSQVLAAHEAEARQNLHTKHPHVGPLLEKHGVDLAKIRHHGAKALTSAAILGSLLAFPHLVHAPTQHHLTNNPPQTKVLSDVDISTKGNHPSPDHNTQTNNQTLTTSQTTSANISKPNEDNDGKDNDESGEHPGRSEFAPPKEHELHDLGYHEGEERHPGQVKSPGPHPEETVEHEKGEF